MNKQQVVGILSIFTLGFSAFAQDRIVKPIPAMAAWEMTQTAPAQIEGSSPENATIQKIRIERTGNMQKVQIDTAEAGNQTLWLADGEIFAEVNDSVSSSRFDMWMPALFSAGKQFFGTEWIQPDHLVRTEEIGGRTLNLYQAKIARNTEKMAAAMAGIAPEELSVQLEAWIDTTTRLPVRVSAPEGTFDYRFLQAPSQPLQLPGVFREKQEAREREVSRQQAEAAIR